MLVNNVGMLDGEEPVMVSGQFLAALFFFNPLNLLDCAPNCMNYYTIVTYLSSVVVCSNLY
jgi:hypothetical protein